jgi:large subunit ribosomal protein L25
MYRQRGCQVLGEDKVMEQRKITATKRDERGKGMARRLRTSGQIPAIAYGAGLSSQPLSVSPKDLVEVIKSERGRNTVIELDVQGGERFSALLCDYQYHPITRSLLHADFLKIDLNQPVDVDVPFELTGKAKGIVMGGVLRQVYRKLPVRCLPGKIPVKIVRDITELELDDHVAASQLELPEGVSVRLPPERTIVAVVMEKIQPEEEAAPAPGAVPAGAAAEGAAPAAAAAPAETKT